MEKEKLEKRIAELIKAKEQFIANANACEGGIVELTSILKELQSKNISLGIGE
jgi:nicotinamide mononucleotide (NMN) deamidase PncC